MNNIKNISQSDDLMDIARKWYLRLEDEAGDIIQLEKFEEWVNADLSHREAFDQVVEFWTHIDSLPEIEELRSNNKALLEITEIPQTPPQSEPVIDFNSATPAYSTQSKWSQWQKYATAATILIICTVLINFYLNYLPEGSYRTATGEQETIHLADGSTVYLNTESKFTVDFTENLRRVQLIKGEAHFEVTKDKSRPFIVETSKGSIRAVGTSFNIYEHDENVEIIVFEGTVAVNQNNDRLSDITDSDELPDNSILVNGGERVIALKNRLSKVRLANDNELSQKNAWLQGKLIFRGQKLSLVIEEMSRYTNKKIVIADDVLSEMKMGGAFDIHDFDALLHAIEDAFPVKIIRFTPYIAVIVKA